MTERARLRLAHLVIKGSESDEGRRTQRRSHAWETRFEQAMSLSVYNADHYICSRLILSFTYLVLLGS